jgi:2-phospho-L-lactate guanylyltransferase
MTCWTAIAIKTPNACKTRLRAALSPDARERLVRAMLDHVVATAEAAADVGRLVLLTPPGHDLARSIERFVDEGTGLNGELTRLTQAAAARGADRLVILPADLPRLRKADIESLSALPPGCAAIAPDRAGSGTNALSLPLPAARDFRFRFGPDSFARHRDDAARLALPLEIIRSDTLGFDVDEPADLLALAESACGRGEPEYPGLHLVRTPPHPQPGQTGRGSRLGPAQSATTGR